MQPSNPAKLQSSINVTPLVDVVLVLLIIFMVIVPLTLHGYDVDIPGESIVSEPVEPSQEQIVLAIDVRNCPVVEPLETECLPDNCRVEVNDEQIAVTQLAGRVADLFVSRDGPDRVLFLAAGDSLNYEGVMRIVDVAKSEVEGLRIGLVTKR